MKRNALITFVAICTLFLISWGSAGHRTVALIAERHLTPAAKREVGKILGTESLVDVSNYADEIRTNRMYNYTGAWHYINVEPGLTFDQFSAAVVSMKTDNVYKMVKAYEFALKDKHLGARQRATALKYLVHLIGDLHQPMHVSNGADEGGNKISVSFMGENGNLHGLWDSGLIEHEGLSYKQMAEKYDTATDVQIKKWQSDDLMIWLWESYQISSILYKETAENTNLTDDYYKAHLPVVQKQIEKAGIRLAGVLNALFSEEAK